MKRLLYTVVALLMIGCNTSNNTQPIDTPPTEKDKDELIEGAFVEHSVRIDFDLRQTSFTSEGAVSATHEGDHFVISASDTTISGIKVSLHGRSDNGSVKIYGNVPVFVEMYQLRLTSQQGAVINCQSKKRMWIKTSGCSYLTDATKYKAIESEDCKGAIFSEGQIILCDDSQCKITARGGHGIASDDYIRIMGGEWRVNSVKDGLHANDYIRMNDGIVEIEAGSDGIDCKEGSVELLGGELEIRCVDDGISANRPKEKKNKKGNKADSTATAKPKKTVRADVTINHNPNINIHTTGPKGSGVKADQNIVINGGATLNIEVDGDASKGLNAGECCIIGGDVWCSCCTDTTPVTINLVANGKVLVNPKNNDTSSPKGIKADSLVLFEGFPIVHIDVPYAGEGIESKGRIEINGGEISAQAWDDAMNAGRSFVLNNGELFLRSWNNDGLDSNGTIEINNGYLTAWGGDIPEAGIDCDMNRFAINGGLVIGVGGMTSTPTEGECTQASIIARGVRTMGVSVGLYDSNKDCINILVGSPTLPNATVLWSAYDILADSTYYIRSADTTYTKAVAALGHKALMPPPPPAGVHPHNGKMPPPPHDGKMPPPPPGGFPEGTPPPPPALPKMQAR